MQAFEKKPVVTVVLVKSLMVAKTAETAVHAGVLPTHMSGP